LKKVSYAVELLGFAGLLFALLWLAGWPWALLAGGLLAILIAQTLERKP